MTLESKYIWMDGKMLETEKATVPFLTSALHYGMAVFEGIRCYDTVNGPAVFRLSAHAERLVNSAKIMGFRDLPFTTEEIKQAIKDTVKANGFKSCYIRPLVYDGGPNFSLNLDEGEPKVGVAAWDMGAYLGDEAVDKGIRVNVSSFTRHHPNVMMTKSKTSGNYANSMLAKTESCRLGFDEAIMLDPQGYVAECTGENFFIVRNGTLYTSQTSAILEGITRDSLVTLAKDLGIPVGEQLVSRDHLYVADEALVCGTAAEVVAVTEIDFRKIGNGHMGPVTRKLQQAFRSVVRGEHPRSAEWLESVN
jgi:branched-chain amino acid aminotransferase